MKPNSQTKKPRLILNPPVSMARVRVVTQPPLPPYRAWVPLQDTATIGDLQLVVQNLLALDGQCVRLELEGAQITYP